MANLLHFIISWHCTALFLVAVFSKTEIENMYYVFLSSYTNTRESLGELEKGVETLATRLRLVFPQHFSFSQTSTRDCITR